MGCCWKMRPGWRMERKVDDGLKEFRDAGANPTRSFRTQMLLYCIARTLFHANEPEATTGPLTLPSTNLATSGRHQISYSSDLVLCGTAKMMTLRHNSIEKPSTDMTTSFSFFRIFGGRIVIQPLLDQFRRGRAIACRAQIVSRYELTLIILDDGQNIGYTQYTQS